MRFSAVVSVLITMSVTNAEVSSEPQSKGVYYSDDSEFMNQYMEPASSHTLKLTGTPIPTALPLTATPAPIPTPTPMISTKTMTGTVFTQTVDTSYKTSLDSSGAVDLSVVSGLCLAMAIGQLFVLL